MYTEREKDTKEIEKMNEKITRQIEEMKKQTIGVEVEMNNITREKAARLTAEFFGTGIYGNTAAETAIAHGQLGTARAESGNSKKM